MHLRGVGQDPGLQKTKFQILGPKILQKVKLGAALHDPPGPYGLRRCARTHNRAGAVSAMEVLGS